LDAGRLLLVDEAHGHFDGDDRVGADAQEVDMHREVAHRVELVGLGQHAHLAAADVDGGDGGEEAAAVDLVVDVLVGQGDGQGGLVVAVDDGRYLAVAPNLAGGPLTDPFARLGLQLVSLVAHGFSFRGSWSAPGPEGSETSRAAAPMGSMIL